MKRSQRKLSLALAAVAGAALVGGTASAQAQSTIQIPQNLNRGGGGIAPQRQIPPPTVPRPAPQPNLPPRGYMPPPQQRIPQPPQQQQQQAPRQNWGNNGNNRNNGNNWGNRPPNGYLPPAQTRQTAPGYIPGNIYIPTAKVFIPNAPVYNPGSNYPDYYYGGTTTYYNGYNNGYNNGYAPAQPTYPSGGYVAPGPITVYSNGDVLTFGGYASSYVSGSTFVSPFGTYYNCPPYIRSRYAIRTPYPYVGARIIRPLHLWADNDTYYTSNPDRGRALRASLNDISRYWENDDTRSLRRHVDSGMNVAIFRGGTFQYSLQRDDFVQMANDALSQVNTVAFRFTSIQERSDGMVDAIANHTYRLPGNGGERTTAVRCTLAYEDGDWFLNAVSLSADT